MKKEWPRYNPEKDKRAMMRRKPVKGAESVRKLNCLSAPDRVDFVRAGAVSDRLSGK